MKKKKEGTQETKSTKEGRNPEKKERGNQGRKQ